MAHSLGGFDKGEDIETGTVSRNPILGVLADQERCEAIEYLAMEPGPVSLDDLASFLAATSVSTEGPPHSQERTKIQFHHIHLPKMEDAGLLDYDSDDQKIEPTEKLDLTVQRLN